jgi:hypothetical protein
MAASKPHEVIVVICNEEEGVEFKSLGWFSCSNETKS